MRRARNASSSVAQCFLRPVFPFFTVPTFLRIPPFLHLFFFVFYHPTFRVSFFFSFLSHLCEPAMSSNLQVIIIISPTARETWRARERDGPSRWSGLLRTRPVDMVRIYIRFLNHVIQRDLSEVSDWWLASASFKDMRAHPIYSCVVGLHVFWIIEKKKIERMPTRVYSLAYT